MKSLGLFFITLLLGTLSWAAPTATLKGTDILTGKTIEVRPQSAGTVVVFLSATCPCSNSHVKELKALAQEHPEMSFVAVHSNVDEELTPSQEYFQKAQLGFPTLQDHNTAIADEFKALKTPHAFVVNRDGTLLYQGGVSSSRDITTADRKFLREALEDLQQKKSVRTPEGRTLGCAISRGEKNVW